MQADWAVELGSEDETLEVPWAAPDHGPRYLDLKRHPELLLEIDEARRELELGEFLAATNGTASFLETAKCDAWAGTEIQPKEETFGASHKFGSYVDLFFADDRRYSFPEHERLAKRLSQLLRRVPEIPAAAEFLIRRCYFHYQEETRDGYYITFYLFGYGDEEGQARRQWAIGLKLVENAIRQLSASPF